MPASSNPFYIEPANPLQALMLGVQGFDRSQKIMNENDLKAGRLEAVQTLQSGQDVRPALAKLIGIGDVQGAKAIAEYAHQQSQEKLAAATLANTQAHQKASLGIQQGQLAETSRYHSASIENDRQRLEIARRSADASMEGQKVPPGFTRGADGSLAPVPGGPADPNYIKAATGAKGVPLTATDKKAIIEADEGVLAAETAIDGLKKAKELSKKAYSGPLAKERGYYAGLAGNEGGQATTELDTTITANALSQLKSIFGGMPTEGERKILLDIQGSVNQPHAVRQKIYDDAIAAANRRLEFNRRRATEMRGGSFYSQQPAQSAPQPAPPSTAMPPPPPGFQLVK
jgi:hypothetical protein